MHIHSSLSLHHTPQYSWWIIKAAITVMPYRVTWTKYTGPFSPSAQKFRCRASYGHGQWKWLPSTRFWGACGDRYEASNQNGKLCSQRKEAFHCAASGLKIRFSHQVGLEKGFEHHLIVLSKEAAILQLAVLSFVVPVFEMACNRGTPWCFRVFTVIRT